MKLDSNGNFLWAKSFKTNHQVIGCTIKTDKYGDVYTSGFFNGEVDFDPGPGIYNLGSFLLPLTYNIFISKLDSNGDYVWTLDFGKYTHYGWYPDNSFFLDKSNNLYLIGCFNISGDFDPGPDTFNLIVPIQSYDIVDIFVLKLSQCQASADTLKVSTCHSYTWFDGKTYTKSTDTAKYIIENKAGCDSIITLNLTILKPDSTTVYHEACKNYEWKGNTLAQSGIYQYDTLNVQGCDSTVLLNLTITKPDTISISYATCDSYIWHNYQYEQSGIYFFDTISTRGCDSTVMLNLTINDSKKSESFQTSCDSYLWNGNTYTQSGIYQYKTQTISGCDSTITLNLTINKSNNIALSQSACDSYTWNGNNYDQSGSYTYQTINSAGCDSMVTINLIITDHIERSDTINICEGDSIKIFGNWIAKEGEISEIFTSSAGCDSIQTYNISVRPLPSGQIAGRICEGDSVYIIDRWFDTPGTFTVKKPILPVATA
ncbi:MAG: hypothetical protein IPH57_17250 [Saprospiraceae bacterium]|nr:hypothetical protein [Saprospiraceae bacterium]